MAATYTPNDAFTLCKTLVKSMPLDDVKIQILDDAFKKLWHAAPWRWTLAAFPTVTLVANTQDYTVSVPADFLYLQEAILSEENGNNTRDLNIIPLRVAGGDPGQPSEVSVSGTTLRTYPKIGTVRTGSTVKIISTYKKSCPQITISNTAVAGTLVFDDDWFWVYNSIVMYYAYLYADDQRAGSATIASNGQWQYTGMLAVAEANLQLMREREKLSPQLGRPEQKAK